MKQDETERDSLLLHFKIITLMKFLIFILFIIQFTFSSTSLHAQCSVYIQMQPHVECVLPVVVNTNEVLTPCSAPAAFYELKSGDFGYIEYSDTSCNTICMTGHTVAITCFSLPVGTDHPFYEDPIKVYPTVFQSVVHLEGKNIIRSELYNDCGERLKSYSVFPQTGIRLLEIGPGMYYFKIYTRTGVQVSRIIKF
jgi:hypothetical protein